MVSRIISHYSLKFRSSRALAALFLYFILPTKPIKSSKKWLRLLSATIPSTVWAGNRALYTTNFSVNVGSNSMKCLLGVHFEPKFRVPEADQGQNTQSDDRAEEVEETFTPHKSEALKHHWNAICVLPWFTPITSRPLFFIVSAQSNSISTMKGNEKTEILLVIFYGQTYYINI